MKIVQLITRLDVLGGAQNHVVSLSKQLIKDGHDVIVITGSYKEELWMLERENIKVIVIQTLLRNIHFMKDIQSILYLRKAFKTISPELIAIHSSKAGAVGRLAALFLPVNTIFTAHGWSFTEGVSPIKKAIYKKVETLLRSITSKVIAVSEYDRGLAIEQKVIHPEKIVAIQNGIDLIEQSLSPINKKEARHIVMVARFEHPKRQDLLIEALRHLTNFEWTVSFVGEGNKRGIVESQVDKYELNNRVRFLSSTTNVESLLKTADLFVLLSDFEGLPISIIEAMRAGLPVIASNVGGVCELVTHEKSGFVVDHFDQKELQAALEKLLTDEQLSSNMGAFGYDQFLRQFTFDQMYNKTLKQYYSVCHLENEIDTIYK